MRAMQEGEGERIVRNEEARYLDTSRVSLSGEDCGTAEDTKYAISLLHLGLKVNLGAMAHPWDTYQILFYRSDGLLFCGQYYHVHSSGQGM